METHNISSPAFVFATGLALILFAPHIAFAQIIISEIMYDLDGSDSGREWIEVFNAGGSSVNLTEWKLVEADTNHKIAEVQGGAAIASGAYAVIADNAATFLADHPGFSGLLFDSAFSLNNSGEPLGIRNTDGVDTDALSYDGSMGAAGDGSTLHRSATSGTALAAAAATPGTGTLAIDSSLEVAEVPASTNGENDEGAEDTGFVVGKNQLFFPVEPQVYAYVGEDREVIVGADVELIGRAFVKDGTPLTDARFLWNFGDGVVAEGERVMHRWNYPGKYILVLDIAKNKYAASDEVIITAVPAQLAVGTKDGGIAITNNAGKTIDLSHWHLYSNRATFSIPEGTKILPKATVIFGRDAIGTMTVVQPVELRYPNGLLAVREGEIPAVPAPAPPQQKTASIPAQSTTALVKSPALKTAEPEGHEFEMGDFLQQASAESRVDAAGSGQLAAAGSVGALPWGWVAGLLLLIGVSGIGAIALRRSGRRAWDIVEEKE